MEATLTASGPAASAPERDGAGRGTPHRPWRTWALCLGILGLAALSLLAPSQPGYDPWAWLLWGRELTELSLDTTDGPAFKPLPVAISALFSVFGDTLAPALWLVLARAGAIAAVLLAGRVAWRLTGGSRVAAVVAAAGVVLCQGWWWHAAVGNGEGLFLALVLLATDAALGGHHRRALLSAAAAGLLRPEAWPFLFIYGLWLSRRDAALRPLLLGIALALPAAWFVPELLGSGDLLRSSQRALVPNPGAPATADHPAWASLRAAAAIPLAPVALLALAAVPLGLGALRTRRSPALLLLTSGALAWVLLVALMAQRGYSGEPRYALPGAALLAVAAGVAAARLPRVGLIALVLIMVPFVVERGAVIADELQRAADDAALWSSLDDALADGGGSGALLARCGPAVTGRYRGTGVAYALHVPKQQVDADGRRTAGLVLRSRVRPEAAVQPARPTAAAVVGRSARWEVACHPR